MGLRTYIGDDVTVGPHATLHAARIAYSAAHYLKVKDNYRAAMP